MTCLRSLVLSFLIFGTCIHAVVAQSMGTGTIKGTLTDPSGAAVTGAQVTVQQLTTGGTRSATTDDHGVYVIPDLQIGTYTVTVTAQGFQKSVQNNVHLDADTSATVNISLAIGGTDQTVTVSSAPPMIQTENGEISTTVTGAQVSELSLNGRNFTQYLSFSPGVASAQTGRRMGVGQEGNPLLSINGGRVNDTKFTFDGILAMDTEGFALTAVNLRAFVA